jgi:hypothetical protein
VIEHDVLVGIKQEVFVRKVHPIVLLAALTSSLVLAASLALPASAASGAAPSGRVIARGKVTGVSGHAMPGATVRLYAWPSDRVLQRLKPGQAIPMTLLATAKATSSGTYQLRASAKALLKAAVYNGYANLEIDSGTASWSLPYRASTASPADSPAATANVPTVNLSSRIPSRFPPPCSWVYVKQLKPAWTQVGQGYVLTSGISQQFTYDSGQSSSLGVGLSESGDAGSFHADGTRSESSGQSQNFRKHFKGYDWYESEFRVAKDALDCEGQGTVEHRVRSNGYFGGARDAHPKKRPKYQQCAREAGGTTVKTHKEKAVTWSFGFHVDAVDFDGSAQTGYDTSAQIVYKFGRRGGYECGTNNAVPAKAPQLIIRGP